MRTTRILVTLLMVVFIASIVPTKAVASPGELHVGPGQTYTTIQAAVSASDAYDIVVVHDSGSSPDYEENVVVDIDYLTIKAATGDDVSVKAANPSQDVFHVTGDHIIIAGLSIYGATGSPSSGVYLDGVSGAVVRDVLSGWDNLHSNCYGIRLSVCSGCVIVDNTCSNNANSGIYMTQSGNNVISRNTAEGNDAHGIQLKQLSNDNVISLNHCNNNVFAGIDVESSMDNTISRNSCSYDASGLQMLFASISNEVFLNNLFDNAYKEVYSSSGSVNVWQSKLIEYSYNGSAYTNYLGNFYDGYAGLDNGNGGRTAGDGVGDTSIPYSTDGSGDAYPLMTASDNYEVVIPGDADGDVIVSLLDWIMVRGSILGSSEVGPGADVDEDGDVDVVDWVMVKRIVQGLDF